MSSGNGAARRAEQRADEDRRNTLRAIETAKEPTFFEKQAEEEYKTHTAWRDKKDYRTPPPGMISLGLGDPAQRQRMRERTFNMADTGITALGGEGNATALQMAKMNMADTFDRDQAASYEEGVAAEDAAIRGRSLPYAQMAGNRQGMIAGQYGNMYQSSSQMAAQMRPIPLLPSLISGGLGVLSAGILRGGRS